MLQARCPKCESSHCVGMGIIRSAGYGGHPLIDLIRTLFGRNVVSMRATGYLMHCSWCGTEFCVAGGQVYRYLGGKHSHAPLEQPPNAREPNRLDELTQSRGRWNLQR